MPQSVQIVPTYHYPYVHTVINDNSQMSDSVVVNQTSPIVNYAFPFVSGKGIDNVFVKKTSLAGCKQTYGESNYKKYGQPYMMPLNVLNEENANVWCMRVMPENATYSNSVILLWYKADDAKTTVDISTYVKVDASEIVTTVSYEEATTATAGALKVVASTDDVIVFTASDSSVEGALEVVANDTDPFDETTQIKIGDVTGITVEIGQYVVKTVIPYDATTMVTLAEVIETLETAAVGDYVTKITTKTGPEGSLVVVENTIRKSRFNPETMVKLETVVADIPDAEVGDFVTINTETRTLDPDERKFRIKFTQQSIKDATTKEIFEAEIKNIPLAPVDGWTPIVFMSLRSEGRGTYGDDFRLKVSQNSSYEKEYGIKMYNFNVLSIENGLTSVATYTGSIVSSVQYEASTLINDVLSSVDAGVAPLQIEINEDGLENVYDAYVEFCKALNVDLNTQLAEILDSDEVAEYPNFDKMVEGLVPIPAAIRDTVLKVRKIDDLIDASDDDGIGTIDEFDPILGLGVASTTTSRLISFETPDGTISFIKNDKGIVITDGSNGYFDEPRVTDYNGTVLKRKTEKTVDQWGNIVDARDENGNIIYINDSEGHPIYVNETGDEFSYTDVRQWTVDDEVEECYNNAFNGTLDSRILSVRRIGVDAWFDANYPYSVKKTLVDLATTRNDAIVYLDTGITDTSYTSNKVDALVKDYNFNDKLVVVNLQHFKTREAGTLKKVDVSITYFLARQYAVHVIQNGYYIPMVKGRCELSNHVKDSLQPTIDDYQADIKEMLYANRFNYFETVGENRFQRGSQVTTQLAETDLIEENNVQTLFKVKRIVEEDIADALYDFTDESTRAIFTDYEKEKFSSWIGTRFKSFNINFTVNAWEFEHSIVHCYIEIVFRSLQKQAILEIDINKREFTGDEADASSDEFKFRS